MTVGTALDSAQQPAAVEHTLYARLERALIAAWLARGPLARALWPLSIIYRAVLALRGLLPAAAERLPVPVIVIGNVVAGGAGKTPTTLAVAQDLQARGWHPGILARGYRRDGDGVRLVAPDDDPRAVGDEPLLLAQISGLPVAVGQARAQAGRALLAAHPDIDVLVCDDGLQHRRLACDVAICVFDTRGIGNRWLLPAGPLREPWPRPVDLILGTEGTVNVPLPPGVPVFAAWRCLTGRARRADGTQIPLADLREQCARHGQPLIALAGIARPQAFFDMLRATGLPLTQTLALPDHADLENAARALDQRATLICTEKDAVKLWRWRPDAWATPLALNVPRGFFRALGTLLAARGYHSGVER
jgi:tetraacyldisaccharide 4'-kinase